MKACVKAWQAVINPAIGKVHDEVGFRALDALFYGPVREVDDVTDEIAEEMVTEFERLHPDFRYDQFD